MYNQVYGGRSHLNSKVWKQLQIERTERLKTREDGAVGLPTIPVRMQSCLQVTLKVAGTLLLTTVGVVSFGFWVWAYGAAAGPYASGAIAPPSPIEFVLPEQPVRVQPHSWKFAPPDKSDLSPDSVRVVDELYGQLMREYSNCSAATLHSPGRLCKAR
jgi:hypothetical protein